MADLLPFRLREGSGEGLWFPPLSIPSPNPSRKRKGNK